MHLMPADESRIETGTGYNVQRGVFRTRIQSESFDLSRNKQVCRFLVADKNATIQHRQLGGARAD